MQFASFSTINSRPSPTSRFKFILTPAIVSQTLVFSSPWDCSADSSRHCARRASKSSIVLRAA